MSGSHQPRSAVRLPAMAKALGISAAISLLVFVVLGIIAPIALSLVFGGEASLGGGMAAVAWALFIVAPICVIGFVMLSIEVYGRFVPPNKSLERTRDG